MAAPIVVAEPPPAWVAADVARPTIAEASGAAWSSWRASRAPNDDAAIVTACVVAPVPGWVEDMRPAFVARTVALAGATGTRIVGSPVETFDAGEALGVRAVGSAPDATPTLGAARTFLGFEGTQAATCFVVCAARGAPNAASRTCNEVVVRARLEGGDDPPRAGLVLRTVTWAVHHPQPTLLGFGAATVLAGIAAVATRRRPRART